MVLQPQPRELLGRSAEIDALSQVVAAAGRGESAVIVVHGDAGVGKTALVDHVLTTNAADARVLRVIGVESEMELPFAGLHQLLAPVIPDTHALPEPQRDALLKVFGLMRGDPPDRFFVGLGALNLLAGLAADTTLICFIDDAQWLDHASAQTLAFVARRLLADRVAMFVAARTITAPFDGLPKMTLFGVDADAARVIFDTAFPFVVDSDVRERVLSEAQGNPLALIEMYRGLSPAQLAGGLGVAGALPIATRMEETFRRRVETLPADTQRLLLVAAAEPVGDPGVVFAAAASLGIGRDSAAAAESEGLIEVGARVLFRHPLVRSGVYGAASPAARGRAHRALADATDVAIDPDRRAWHLAQSATAPSDEVADELERSASQAQARGGYAAAAEFLERAAALTREPAERSRRALAAAETQHLAGAYDGALRTLRQAENGPLDQAQRAQVDLLRAEMAYTQRRGNDAPELLLRAADRLVALDVRAARGTYLDAVLAGHFAGRLARGTGLRDVAQAALQAPAAPGPPTASDLLLDGLATALVDGYAAAVRLLQKAVAAFCGPTVTPSEELRWLWPAAHVAMALWDDASYELLSARHIELARASGLLAVMPTALTTRIVSSAFMGDLAAADRRIRELHTLTEAMQVPTPPYGPLFVSGWRGDEANAADLRRAATEEVTDRGEGAGLSFADYAHAVLCNGLGRYEEALDVALAADAFETDGFVIYTAALPELIEAAIGCGQLDRAREALARLLDATTAADTDWSGGVSKRSQAMLSRNGGAEPLYRESIEQLARTRVRPQLARTHLLFGEWLGRARRHQDAREQLRIAYDMFADMGMRAFAERARQGLIAVGETVREPSMQAHVDLTEQEAHIAQLAVDGYTNPEIAAQLFISARTVEWHLGKVFTKLGVTSRRQLSGALTTRPTT